MKIEDLKKELLGSFKERAESYYLIYEAMSEEFGAEAAKRVMSKAIRKRGNEKAEKYRSYADKNDYKGLSEAFVASSAGCGELFTPSIESVEENGCTVVMESCPLIEAWKERGLSAEMIETLCDIASEVDYGKYEAIELELKFGSRLGCGDKSCRLQLSKKK